MCLNTKLTFIPYILSVIMQQVLYNYFQIPLLFHLKSTQKWHTHPLSRPQGRNLGCLLWVQTDLSFLKSARNRHDTASPWRQGVGYWPALRAGLLCCNFFGQPGSVSKFPPLLWVKLWVGWVGRGYTEISRYFPASWINFFFSIQQTCAPFPGTKHNVPQCTLMADSL